MITALYFMFEPTIQLIDTEDKIAWQESFVELIENNPQIPYLHYGLCCVAIEEKNAESIVTYIEENGWECTGQSKPYFGYSLDDFHIGQQVYEDGIKKVVIGFGEQDDDDTIIVEYTSDEKKATEQYIPIIEKERKITENGQSFYRKVKPYLYEKSLMERPL